MIGLDTNVLVRFVVKDDKRQANKASSFIRKAISNGERLYINCTVLCEFVWVLESCYSFKKHEIYSVLEKILITKQFEIELKEIVRKAIDDYRNGKGDLSDYLIGRINNEQGCVQTITFDKTLKNHSLFKLLQ